jgi:predicted nuclease with RNAse H fold
VSPHLSNDDTPDSTPSFGIDVGARLLHVVALDGAGDVMTSEVRSTADVAAVADTIASAGATSAAIDSPTGWSTAPHAADATLSPKFRFARCAEVGLGRDHGIWVPWTTPVDPGDGAGWMRVGVALAAALRARGVEPLEVYPHAAFRVLNRGRRLPAKQTWAGREARHALLCEAAVTGTAPLATSHDALDAAAAALVALHHRLGRAQPATCGHDGSAIWLPAGVAEPAGPPS